MSKEYPLYPELKESGKQASQELINKFKKEMKRASKDVIDDFYTDVAVYVEEDSWINYRNELMDGLCNYNNKLIQGKHDFKRIRQAILKEHKEDIIKDLNQDLVEEVKKLKEDIEFIQRSRSQY